MKRLRLRGVRTGPGAVGSPAQGHGAAKLGFSITAITHPVLLLSYLPGLVVKVPVQTHRKLSSNVKDTITGSYFKWENQKYGYQ